MNTRRKLRAAAIIAAFVTFAICALALATAPRLAPAVAPHASTAATPPAVAPTTPHDNAEGHWEKYCSADLTRCWMELDPWTPPTYVGPRIPGDDNGDGVVDEDESGWDCHTMGNRVCGADQRA